MDREINYRGKYLLFSIIWRKFIFLLYNIIFCIFQEFMSVCKNLSAKQVCSIRSCLCLSSIILILRWMMRSQNSTLAEMKSNDGDILSCQFFNTTTSTILLPIIPSKSKAEAGTPKITFTNEMNHLSLRGVLGLCFY